MCKPNTLEQCLTNFLKLFYGKVVKSKMQFLKWSSQTWPNTKKKGEEAARLD